MTNNDWLKINSPHCFTRKHAQQRFRTSNRKWAKKYAIKLEKIVTDPTIMQRWERTEDGENTSNIQSKYTNKATATCETLFALRWLSGGRLLNNPGTIRLLYRTDGSPLLAQSRHIAQPSRPPCMQLSSDTLGHQLKRLLPWTSLKDKQQQLMLAKTGQSLAQPPGLGKETFFFPPRSFLMYYSFFS